LRSWTSEASFIAGQRTDVERIREIMNEPYRIILVTQVRVGIAGCVSVDVSERLGHFGMLSVGVPFQKGGMAKALIRAAESWAADQGAREMRLQVLMNRPELISYYERQGYRMTEERIPFPNGEPRFGEPLIDGLMFGTMSRPISD